MAQVPRMVPEDPQKAPEGGIVNIRLRGYVCEENSMHLVWAEGTS